MRVAAPLKLLRTPSTTSFDCSVEYCTPPPNAFASASRSIKRAVWIGKRDSMDGTTTYVFALFDCDDDIRTLSTGKLERTCARRASARRERYAGSR